MVSTINSIMDPSRVAFETHFAELLRDGRVHLESEGDEHVFLVQVKQVPRQHLLQAGPVEVGRLGGARARLIDVITDNRLSVVLEAEALGGPVRAQPDEDGWPADRLLAIGLVVADDVGTSYTTWTAESGGDAHPWRAVRRFLPPPPVAAKVLRVLFNIEAAAHEVVLPSPVRDAGPH